MYYLFETMDFLRYWFLIAFSFSKSICLLGNVCKDVFKSK